MPILNDCNVDNHPRLLRMQPEKRQDQYSENSEPGEIFHTMASENPSDSLAFR